MPHPLSSPCIRICWLCMVIVSTAVSAPAAIMVEDARLRDDAGRQLFLWGMNVGEKSSARNHESWHGPEEFMQLRRWGMNAVRLLIFWSAVEPQPGRYDETYLQSVDRRIQWAEAAGLYVILDMHQDLWSEAIPGGNGAPAWATLDEGRPHYTPANSPWSAAYFTSPRVHRAFDNFWANTAGPDGVGIQDRFALAWQQVAARYADRPSVIGFDLLNEPFPGSPILEVALCVWRAIPDIFRGADMPRGFVALAQSLQERPYPSWLLDALDEPARHERLLAAIAPVNQQFEEEQLMPMYQRVHRAIRKVNEHALIFLEPSVLANIGTPTVITPLRLEEGTRDLRQVYMPHAYDIVVDTALSHQPSANRLAVIFDHKLRDAARLAMPLLIGEWGAFYGHARTRSAARVSAAHIEKKTTGAFYWDYHRNMEEAVYFESLARPNPLALAGKLISSQYDPETGAYQCSWEADPSIPAPSRFAAPQSWSPSPPEVRLEAPEHLAAQVISMREDPPVVEISVAEAAHPAIITLRMTPSQ